jgi:hypothetical protein
MSYKFKGKNVTKKQMTAGNLHNHVLKLTNSEQVFQDAGTPVSSASKTDRHDVTEILMKVVLNIITQMIILDEKIHLFYIYEIL